LRRHGFGTISLHGSSIFLPVAPGHVGRNSEKGQLAVCRSRELEIPTGAPRRAIPKRFGYWKNIHKRLSRGPKTAFGRIFSRPQPTIRTTNTP